MLVGFRSATIGIYDPKLEKCVSKIVIEGEQGKGATKEAAISGLSADAVSVYGSNIKYYVSQKGTGDVQVALSILDFPRKSEDLVLGKKVVEGLTFTGEDTEPPYISLLLESEENGEPYFMGFICGKFSKAEKNLKTKEEGNFEPEAEQLTGSFINTKVKLEGVDKPQAVIEGAGEANKTKAESILFPDYVAPTE